VVRTMTNRSRSVVGLAICVLAALLMLTDVVAVGWGSALGVIGIGVIATTGRPTPTTTSSPTT
jgi:hypothetical protein